MNKFSQIKSIILLLLSGAILFYFFLIPFDYQVRFSTHNAPWLIYHLVEINQDNVQLIEEEEGHLLFTARPKATTAGYEYTWEVKREEQKTYVQVKAMFTTHRWKEKISFLFGQSNHVKSILLDIRSFTKELGNTSKEYRWESPVEGVLPGADCLCTTLNARIEDKASKMNQNISLLSSYLPKGKKTPPRLYITDLNLEQQEITFDFCFPLEKQIYKAIEDKSLFITFKPEIIGKKIKFYGNYSQTHRAWYSYLADTPQLESLKLPFTEVFYDSPFGGVEQTKWESETYFKP